MTRYIVFDTETTGVGPDKQAVEVGLLEVGPDLSVLGEAESLICPTVPISAGAQAIHGITLEMVANQPVIEDWVQQTFGGKIEGEVTLIGHKVSFDKPLFSPIGTVHRTLDTLIHAQVNYPEAPNHKLETLRDHLELPNVERAHRAMADVWMVYHLLHKLTAKTGRSLEDFCAIEKMFIHRMPWGKHEGKPLMALPQGYRSWLLGKDIDPNLRYSLEEVAKLDIKLPAPHSFKGGRPKIVIPKRKIS